MWFLNYSHIVDPVLKSLRVYIIKFAGIKAGDKILDVCCGTGDQALYYARAGAVAYGVDLDPRMIKIAEENKRKIGLNNVSFQVADAESLPFGDNFFDYASVSLGLHEKEAEKRNKIISEMKRVVKKEGSLVFVDFKVPLSRGFHYFLIKTIEYFAGREHYEYFKDYLLQGGLGEILKKHQLRIEKKEHTRNGVIEMIKTRK